MTDQDVDLDEATTQTKEHNTNIIDEAIEYNVTDVEFITEVDVTTISFFHVFGCDFSMPKV